MFLTDLRQEGGMFTTEKNPCTCIECGVKIGNNEHLCVDCSNEKWVRTVYAVQAGNNMLPVHPDLKAFYLHPSLKSEAAIWDGSNIIL